VHHAVANGISERHIPVIARGMLRQLALKAAEIFDQGRGDRIRFESGANALRIVRRPSLGSRFRGNSECHTRFLSPLEFLPIGSRSMTPHYPGDSERRYERAVDFGGVRSCSDLPLRSGAHLFRAEALQSDVRARPPGIADRYHVIPPIGSKLFHSSNHPSRSEGGSGPKRSNFWLPAGKDSDRSAPNIDDEHALA